jgi:hypothetical protein
MKKRLFFFTTLALCVFVACDTKNGSKPKIGDAVFYDYVIKQGDSVVYNATTPAQDTAFLILENSNEPDKKILMERLLNLSVNDTVNFALDNQRKGYLRLHRIVTAVDFPKYIEAADKKQQAFETRLKEIGKELNASMPVFKARQKMVTDSLIVFNEQFKKGLLTAQFTPFVDNSAYFIVKGKENADPKSKKWVWFHHAVILPNGKLMHSYNSLPRGTNVGEFSFNEQIERAAARFDEGSVIVMSVPTKLINLSRTTVESELNGSTLFCIEIVKVLEL